MNIIKSVTVLALCLSCGHLSAQETPFKLGVRLGGGISVTTGLDKILVPEDYYSNYSFKDNWQLTLEKPLYFNPFGQTGLLTLAIK